MNELIKQLALDAGLLNYVDHETPRRYFINGHAEQEDVEKFAELIVKECARVIVNGGYWSGGPLGPKRQCTPPEIATMIREHFGVEE